MNDVKQEAGHRVYVIIFWMVILSGLARFRVTLCDYCAHWRPDQEGPCPTCGKEWIPF